MGHPQLGPFTQALLSLDRLSARRILLEARSEDDPAAVFDELVVPALEQIGHEWEEGNVALSQVYMAGRISAELVDVSLPAGLIARGEQPKVGVAVLEDAHALGAQMVAEVLRAAGYEVSVLGTRLSVDEVVEAVLAEGIDVLMISVLMLRAALAVKDVRQRLNEVAPGTRIVVGGAPFRFDPDLGAEVGADYVGHHAGDALAALATLTRPR